MDSEKSSFGTTMLVGPASVGATATPYPVYMSGNSGSGNDCFGGDWGWIILLILLIGGRGFGGYGGMGGGIGDDFPWILNGQQAVSNNVSDGFRSAELGNSITSVRDGIANLSTQLCGCCGDISAQLCNGFAGVNSTVNSGVNTLAQQMYANQIADMQNSFALQSQLSQCCCNNRLATNDLKYTVATEGCATRTNETQNTQTLLTAFNSGIQSIKDQLCQDKIDEKNDIIAQLRQEVLYARGQASQDVQTARLLAGQTSEVDALYNRLAQCPVPCMPVYGMTPIFQCNNGNNGCGGNNF